MTTTSIAPIHKEIAERARALWEKQGTPFGCDEEIWLQAEREVLPAVAAPAKRKDAEASAAWAGAGGLSRARWNRR